MKSASFPLRFLLICLPVCLGLGWLAAGLLADPNPGQGVWITGLVLFALTAALAWIWGLAGGGKSLAWLLAAAFVARLAVGILFDWGLPRYGYPDNAEHQAGYFYTDAHRRDTTALALARLPSSPPLGVVAEDIIDDQYGGLLPLSAWVYRFLSPDGARPQLVMFLGAAAGSAGLAFLHAVARRRLGRGGALAAGIIYALYPQAVILGATQMREPYLISAAAVLLWGLESWHHASDGRLRRRAGLVLAVSLLGMAFFSTRIAVAGMVLVVLYFIVEAAWHLPQRMRPLLLALGAAAVLAAGALTWSWLRESTLYDTYLAEMQSGWVQQVFSVLPEAAHIPFITAYGLLQPMLPAAISDLALPALLPPGDPARVELAPGLLRQVNFWLALGWYALLPALVYAFLATWRRSADASRRVVLLAAGFVLAWALVSSARAGGDQWDNPRYRTIFIAWGALAAVWGWQAARRTRSAWLARLYAVEGIFLLFFSEWYISRYSRLIGRPGFFTLVALTAGFSLLVIIGGWLWDRRWRPGLTNPAEKL